MIPDFSTPFDIAMAVSCGMPREEGVQILAGAGFVDPDGLLEDLLDSISCRGERP